MIKEMKTEICDMLEEIKHRMSRETYNVQTHGSQHSNDRLRASDRQMQELEPHEWRNQTVMIKTQESNHVIPESQEQNFQFSQALSNPSDSGHNDESHKYASRYLTATNREIQ